jgi:hypothetical protein
LNRHVDFKYFLFIGTVFPASGHQHLFCPLQHPFPG